MHGIHGCPGLGQCENSWHEGGCEPYWQYIYDSGFTAEREHDPEGTDSVTQKRLWLGPDEPDECWYRPDSGTAWQREQ
jgi:hypothetical protein